MAHSLLQKDSLDPTISLALLLLEPMLSAAKDEVRCSFLTSIFLAAHAKWEDPSALRIWNAWRKVASPGVKACVRSDITNLLRTAMSDVDSKMRYVYSVVNSTHNLKLVVDRPIYWSLRSKLLIWEAKVGQPWKYFPLRINLATRSKA